MAETLCVGQRIEIRGFGGFSVCYHPPTVKQNPKTGTSVAAGNRSSLHFRTGKDLLDRVNGQVT